MADGNGGLLNDRAVIQIFGDVVGCSTDELDPTVPGPVVRLSALERWQKRMVDVDHLGETLEEITAQHLHVFGQHRKFNLVLFKHLQDPLLRFRFGVPTDGNTNKRNLKGCTQGFQIRMVGDDQGNLHRQLPALNPPEQVLQAVALLAGKNRHTGILV